MPKETKKAVTTERKKRTKKGKRVWVYRRKRGLKSPCFFARPKRTEARTVGIYVLCTGEPRARSYREPRYFVWPDWQGLGRDMEEYE